MSPTGSDSGSGSGTKTGMGIDVRKAYALVIGVGKYENREWSIPVASRDAVALAEILGNPTRCGYPAASNIRLLRDDEATKANILEGLAWLQQRAVHHPDATILVYYSGHGWTEELGEGPRSYLIGYDTKPDQIAADALPADDFIAGLRAIRSSRLLVLLDTCHAAYMAEAKDAVPTEIALSIPSGFSAQVSNESLSHSLDGTARELDALHEDNSPGRAVLTSCSGSQKSWFVPGARLSLFTQHLIEALEGLGTPAGEEFVRVTDLMRWVSKKVTVSAAEIRKEQTPIHKFEGTDFAVARVEIGRTEVEREVETVQDGARARSEGITSRIQGELKVGSVSARNLKGAGVDAVRSATGTLEGKSTLEQVKVRENAELCGTKIR